MSACCPELIFFFILVEIQCTYSDVRKKLFSMLLDNGFFFFFFYEGIIFGDAFLKRFFIVPYFIVVMKVIEQLNLLVSFIHVVFYQMRFLFLLFLSRKTLLRNEFS